MSFHIDAIRCPPNTARSKYDEPLDKRDLHEKLKLQLGKIKPYEELHPSIERMPQGKVLPIQGLNLLLERILSDIRKAPEADSESEVSNASSIQCQFPLKNSPRVHDHLDLFFRKKMSMSHKSH